MNKKKFEKALFHGSNSRHVLKELVTYVALNHRCPSSEMDDGTLAFEPCGECLTCMSKDFYKTYLEGNENDSSVNK